jgi:hypothetical protein
MIYVPWLRGRSKRSRRVQPARSLVGGGEVVAAGQRLGVVGAEGPLTVVEGLLEQRDGPPGVSGRLVGGGEVVAARQRLGVVGAKDPLTIVEGLLEQRDGPPEVPGRLVCGGEVVAGYINRRVSEVVQEAREMVHDRTSGATA